MDTITANDIKKRGVSALTDALCDQDKGIITVRGKAQYVVMTMEKYNALREVELAMAVAEARADYKAGRIASRTIDAHMRRIDDEV